VGYRATLDTLQKRRSAKELNHDSSTSSLWTINYTDCVSQLTGRRVLLYEVLKGDVLYIVCNKRFYLKKRNIKIRFFTTHWLTHWLTGVVNNGKCLGSKILFYEKFYSEFQTCIQTLKCMLVARFLNFSEKG
jgi:hypothetical protein